MKILLDTNIVVYRESDNSSKDELGELYRLIDNNIQMQKYINPTIKSEILQNLSGSKRDLMINRLESYNMLENSSKCICEELKEKFDERDKLPNDINSRVAQNQEKYKKEYDALIKNYDETKCKFEQLEIKLSQQAAKHQMIKDYINTLKKQEKLLTKFDGLVWGSLLESATIKDKDVIVFRFKDGTEING